MAAALQCDVCEVLYVEYKVKPNHHLYLKKHSGNHPVFVAISPQHVNYGEMDLCVGCRRKIVEEYLKAIPVEG